MPLDAALLTAQALAREPHQDSPGWTDAFTAGATRMLEALSDGDHLFPEPVLYAETLKLPDAEVIARFDRDYRALERLQDNVHRLALHALARTLKGAAEDVSPTGSALGPAQ